MLYLKGSKEVKTLLNRAFSHFDFSGLSVLDFPSGSGFSSNHLSSLGAQVTSWDMFPEFFKHATLTCDFADLQKPFPITDEAFDFAIFQEGIEHLPDQLFALKEFHRVLKKQWNSFCYNTELFEFKISMGLFVIRGRNSKNDASKRD